MQSQIEELWRRGYSVRSIARSLGMCRKTVRKFIRRLETAAAASPPAEDTQDWSAKIDWEKVRMELGKGVTFKQLHQQVAPEVPYLAFWRAYRRLQPVAPEVTIRLFHKPGERTQIDYTDGIPITDRSTGKTTKTHLFCGILPFSSYTYGEFVFDQKLCNFIESQERMWRYFGGVTPYVVIDNLKSGVTRAHLYDPDLNPTYCDYANHMGFAVLPARPYRPKDKAGIESNIGVIQKNFYQEVRDRKFYSLRELNECFWQYLKRLSSGVMKEYGISRAERFAVEKDKLKTLPPDRFEITEWRYAKVHPDCHVQVDKSFYSVPYAYVGRSVRVRLGTKLVEIFNENGEAIAAHARLFGIGKYSTVDSHYPEPKVGVARFEIHHAKEQARAIGPETEALVSYLLSREHPLRHLRRVQGILRLGASHVKPEALEYAARQAMTFKKMNLAYIKACALHYQTHGNRPTLVLPRREVNEVHLHQPRQEEVT